MDRLPQKVPHGNLLLHVGGFAEEDKRVMGECPDMAAIEKEAVREGLAQGVAGAVRDLQASSAGGRGGAGQRLQLRRALWSWRRRCLPFASHKPAQ